MPAFGCPNVSFSNKHITTDDTPSFPLDHNSFRFLSSDQVRWHVEPKNGIGTKNRSAMWDEVPDASRQISRHKSGLSGVK